MSGYQSVFFRREVKYLLTAAQYRSLLPTLEQHMVPDQFYKSAISNLYYDTPDFLLIRESLEKPVYKEKLRLRCYAVPEAQSPAFLELKKKMDGVVYKRRETLPYTQAVEYLSGAGGGDSQIFHELDWFLRFYPHLAPRMFLSYDRVSLRGREDAALRMTFDRSILWRTTQLDLSRGVWGRQLLAPGRRLMELKLADAMPLWLADALAEAEIYPVSFSKYGAAYQAMLRLHEYETEAASYA